ncbi:excisionase family DNA-binding protein [Clostridium sp. ZS1]|uniref:excisionase family DNA-binding protein n=1 Tax=Clostridium sp. ZS1 TaxID=2949989 RepID=UPI00207A93B7|nr:excisionase family DNA-binding protein [Clostridium sp. ZS1]
MSNITRKYKTVSEAAQQLGVTNEYVRELLNRALVDKSIKLRGTKVGKEWRIDPKSVNDLLGINVDEESYKKDLYIKELEGKIKTYEVQVNSFKTLASTLQQLIGG